MPSSILHVVPRDGGAPVALPVVDIPLPPHWSMIARSKGYEIAARVRDHLHLALRCTRCDTVSLARVFTLRTAQPLCPTCLRTERAHAAADAGAEFRRRDPEDTRYAFYGLPCGHEVRRQFGLIARAAAGETGLRCDICHAQRLDEEAEQQGWSLHGPDPEGDPRYRLYAHAAGSCGHVQRIARANMISGRVNCARCGEGWAKAESAIYLMRFELPDLRPVMKLGFSRNPGSRLDHQLKGQRDLAATLLRVVPMASGRLALRTERRMHAELRATYPEAVVPPSAYRGLIRVGSEVYAAGLQPVIEAMLDRVAAQHP